MAVDFEGNASLGARTLRVAAVEELADFQRYGYRRADADDAAYQLEVAYRKHGFAFASVDYRQQPGTITFLITEGPRVAVEEIRVTGNDAYRAEELRLFLALQRARPFGRERRWFVRSEIESGVGRMRDYYYGAGYTEVRVEKPSYTFSADRSAVTVSLQVHEGVRYFVAAVTFAGDLPPATREALAAVTRSLVGRPYLPRRKLEVRNAVVEAYGRLGYPDAGAEVRTRHGAEVGSIILDAVIASGPQVRVADVRVSRSGKTRERFIRNRLTLGSGDLYDRQQERASFRRLYRTGLFRKVDLRWEPTSDPNERDLHVELEEEPSREVFFEPGWGSYELLRARVGLREKNLFGTGRIVRAEAGTSVKSVDGLIGLTDPWFLGTPVTADVPVAYRRREEPAFTREETSISFLFSHKVVEFVTVTAGYLYRATRQMDVQVQRTTLEADATYNLGSLKAQLTFDDRDDLFFPTRGQRHFLSGEYASRSLGGDLGFARYTGGARFFLPLTDSTTLAARYTTGLIVPSAEDLSVPLAERFYNGGERTVRSYREATLGPRDKSGDPVGGLGYNTFNLEVRQRLFGNFAGSLFFDYGNVSPNRSRAERNRPPYTSRQQVLSDTLHQFYRDFRPGVGVGVQYLSPVGPARLDCAFNPDARVGQGERRFVWHFSVGMAF